MPVIAKATANDNLDVFDDTPRLPIPLLALSPANRAFIAAMAVIPEHVVDAIAEYTRILAKLATSHNVRCLSVYSCSLTWKLFYPEASTGRVPHAKPPRRSCNTA